MKNKIIAVLCSALMICTTALVSCGDSESDKDANSKKDGVQTNQSDYELKNEITAANSSAASLYDSINTVLVELDENGVDVGTIKSISYSKGDSSVSIVANGSTADGSEVYKRIKEYLDAVKELDFEAAIDGGVCVAVAAKSDSTYTGSKPNVVTVDNYKEYSDDLEKALADAVNKANVDR